MSGARTIEPLLLNIAAGCLRTAPGAIDPRAPLARYGLDSLSSVELALAITEATGIEMDADELLTSPSIAALAARLQCQDRTSRCSAGSAKMQHAAAVGARYSDAASPAARTPHASLSDRILADSQLSADIDPSQVEPNAGGSILLTGATGFLGIHLLAELLMRGDADIECPVRARDDAEAGCRIRAAARRHGMELRGFDRRVHAFAADIAVPMLGRTGSEYCGLTSDVAAVYHCAAQVNWALGYDGLRDANVCATENLLRFASTARRKRVHFVSSVAACYTTRVGAPMNESAAAPDVRGIPLGYAQSKWAAERLVEACRDRGLDATIHRPSLIAGDSVSGLGNDEDLLALLLRGCIDLGLAPEIDWWLDACPVDFVARAIVAAAHAPSGRIPCLHLRNPRAVRFTEAVLWLNLRGYRVRLEPFRIWLDHAEQASRDTGHPLHGLRSFLLTRPEGEGGRTLAEIYADPQVARLSAERSDRLLASMGLACPRISARVLERYFDAWVRRGVLPDVTVERPLGREHDPVEPAASIESQMRSHFGDPRLKVGAMRNFDFGFEHSILGELASWRSGADFVMHARSLDLTFGDGRSRTLELVVKPARDDATVLGVATDIAALCSPQLGSAFLAHRAASGLAGGAYRERRVYQLARDRLRACLPASYHAHEASGALLLERVESIAGVDGATRTDIWQRDRIGCVLDGIGSVHGEWLGRDAEIDCLLGRNGDAELAEAAQADSLWAALSAYAKPWLLQWIGAQGARTQAVLAESAPDWLTQIAGLPRTLVHNDFNPRNLVLRSAPDGPRLCAFDWELADRNLPQRDLVELLSYVLRPQDGADCIDHYVQYHFSVVQRSAGRALDAPAWADGMALAVADFGVRRLPMYFMAHRFRPQAYLQRVTRTWMRLVQVFGIASGDRRLSPIGASALSL